MNVRAQWIALLLIGYLLGGAACSSTSEDDNGGTEDGSVPGDGDGDGDTGDGDGDGDGDPGDGDGDGDGDPGDGDGDGDPGDGDGDGDGDEDAGFENGIVCGPSTCDPEGGCCADAFQGLCGAKVGERGCIKPPEPDENSDPRCPEVMIPGIFSLTSCCVENMCGVNAQGLGAPTDCTELGEFKMAVDERTGGMAPFDIPAPQSCD